MRQGLSFVSLGALCAMLYATGASLAQVPDPAQPATLQSPAPPAVKTQPLAAPAPGTIPQTLTPPAAVAPGPAPKLVTPPPAPMPASPPGCTPTTAALGTSRTIVVPQDSGPLGHMSYPKTLELKPGEVVLTFDDGPIGHYTPMVLDALRAHCAKATFLLVGRMAKARPDLVQRMIADGHTIGTHTYSHVFLNLPKVNQETLAREVLGGIAALRDVVGPEGKIAPFFRFTGLNHSPATDAFVARHGLISLSADFPADDWLKRTPEQVKEVALQRLAAKGSGIILLHDIQQRTAAMFPDFLRELKARGYKIVHIVPERYLPAVVEQAPGDPVVANLQSAPPPRGSRPRKPKKAKPGVAAPAAGPVPLGAPVAAPAKPRPVAVKPVNGVPKPAKPKPAERL